MLTIIAIIIVLVIALLALLERERQRRAKHRASTAALLTYIERLPFNLGLDANRRARWVG